MKTGKVTKTDKRKTVLASLIAKENGDVGIGECIGSSPERGYIYFVRNEDVSKFSKEWGKRGRKVTRLVKNESPAVVRKVFATCRKLFVDWEQWKQDRIGEQGEFLAISEK